jgi:hypothetical protein
MMDRAIEFEIYSQPFSSLATMTFIWHHIGISFFPLFSFHSFHLDMTTRSIDVFVDSTRHAARSNTSTKRQR